MLPGLSPTYFLDAQPLSDGPITTREIQQLLVLHESITNFVAKGWILRAPDPDDEDKTTIEIVFVYTDHVYQLSLQFTVCLIDPDESVDREKCRWVVQYRPHALHRFFKGEPQTQDMSLMHPYDQDKWCAMGPNNEGATLFADIQQVVANIGSTLRLPRAPGINFTVDMASARRCQEPDGEPSARPSRRTRSPIRRQHRLNDAIQRQDDLHRRVMRAERLVGANLGMWWPLNRGLSESVALETSVWAQLRFFGVFLIGRERLGPDGEYKAMGRRSQIECYSLSFQIGTLLYKFKMAFHGHRVAARGRRPRGLEDRLHYMPGTLHDAFAEDPTSSTVPFPTNWPLAVPLCLEKTKGLQFLLAEIRRTLHPMSRHEEQMATVEFLPGLPPNILGFTPEDYMDVRHTYCDADGFDLQPDS
ncbi:hypothetical protein PUNSTDRAFT_137429 [Punctularia strigosozonata HHB-11173 SS5]|uniref:uncharacterized protein n=1 Tax=Punctularia strigosozonata (strain HHB-11173) TaxID=741275 RepID=UPI0004416886|nr:uncharacterized protein PUNSTDRAFT_137429 [Punctularia strigosozonata HHB-11173 SS5]EIN05944.1 hypothetical protein PUNSTDRAFT_137429 [Punctularia strigosozonata HHB-11173 SS5]